MSEGRSARTLLSREFMKTVASYVGLTIYLGSIPYLLINLNLLMKENGYRTTARVLGVLWAFFVMLGFPLGAALWRYL